MTLFYMHVPKAGGTTLNHILDRRFRHSKQFEYSTVEPVRSMHSIEKMPSAKKRRLKIIRGHFAYGFHEWFDINQFKYFTVIRNPIERVISHYYYSARKRNHYLFEVQQKKDISFIEYITRICPEARNGISKQIAGAYVNDNFGYGKDFKDLDDQKELYEIALENIKKHFVMVGITERFDNTLILLKKILGGTRANYLYYRLNQNPKHTNDTYRISENEKQCLIENNWADLKLYDFCLKEFDSLPNSEISEQLNQFRINSKPMKYLLNIHRKINRLL